VAADLKELVEPFTGGDPMTEALFVRRSLRQLSAELAQRGHDLCPTTVGELLREQGYALRVNVKRFTGPPHPDRDSQFRYLDGMMDAFRAEGWPILSVDTKKKELLGNFKNAGAVWRQSGDEVNAHDLLADAVCRVVPYGLYDCLADQGHVVVGTSADTPAFAVEAIAAWWGRIGSRRYRGAGALLLLADAGGSNSCRARLWKQRWQKDVADRYGLVVTVCHYPTGASKWNAVEHRLFGPISTNWAGVPLRSPEVMLACLRGTRTRTGLRVSAEWRDRPYAKGVKVSDGDMEALQIIKHEVCPPWNYTIEPHYLWN
jgi:Rhodopirellula transposase DDE domain